MPPRPEIRFRPESVIDVARNSNDVKCLALPTADMSLSFTEVNERFKKVISSKFLTPRASNERSNLLSVARS